MERSQNIVSLSGSFLIENIWAILLVSLLLLIFSFYFAAKNIKIVKQKTKLDKVIMIEKMENIITQAKNNLASPDSCSSNDKKEVCIALGNCVWTEAKEGKNIIEKCLATEKVNDSGPPGSQGPTDICYCSSEGKLIPWEKYYYMKGSKIIGKKGKFCSAKGNKCKYV